MGIRILNYFLAVLGLGGHALLITVLIRRKLTVRLPLFAILIVFYLLRSGILLLGNFPAISAWPYWILVALDPLLQCILYATIVQAFWPLALESKHMRVLAGLGLAVTAAAVSGVAAWYIGPSSHFSAANLSIKAGIFVSVLWIEAGIALAASSAGLLKRLPGLTQKVVQGFAIYSAANVITEIGHRHFAVLRAAVLYVGLSYMRIGVYLLCLALWITACFQDREPQRMTAG